MAQEKLAEALEVDLQELRKKYEAEYKPVVAAADPASEEEVESGSRPAKLRHVYRRVPRAYLKLLLCRELLSDYTVLGARRLEQHRKQLPWERVLEVVSTRKREAEVLREIFQEAKNLQRGNYLFRCPRQATEGRP